MPTNRFRDWLFHQVHSNNLVYNTCWEDPRCDRKLLELNPQSEVVMITSAGCNTLDYLLDHPSRIHCIDVNPRQNALLELKKAIFQKATFEELFLLFGKGVYPDIDQLYRTRLKEGLPGFAQEYWDKNVHFFSGKGIRKSFYHYSTSGTFAWLASKYFKTRKSLYEGIQRLFEADSIDRQIDLYFQIEKQVLNPLLEWIVNRHLTMCLIGVPRSQQLLFTTKYDRGAMGFIQECLRKVFTQLPVKDNYFWRLYLQGAYTHDCCPSYLKKDYFSILQEQIDKIKTYNSTVSGFLTNHPGAYSHYILLDHQDWLAENNRPALEEEWRLILANSRPGTRILLRSAAEEIDFFPSFVHDAVQFEKERTRQIHREDRVGTYASVYLGIVQ